MAASLYLRNGRIEGLHTDVINLTHLGQVEVKRASNVEFNNTTQRWEVILPDGKVIYDNAITRVGAIEQEVAFFEQRLFEGYRPFAEEESA